MLFRSEKKNVLKDVEGTRGHASLLCSPPLLRTSPRWRANLLLGMEQTLFEMLIYGRTYMGAKWLLHSKTFDQCMIGGIALLWWNCIMLWHLDGLRSMAPVTPSFLWPLAHLMSTTIFIVGDYYPHWQLNKLWHWPWEIHLKSSNGRTEIGTQAPPFLPQPSHYSIKIPLYGELWLVTKIIEIYTHLSRQASCFAYIILDRIRKWKIQWYFFFIWGNQGKRF